MYVYFIAPFDKLKQMVSNSMGFFGLGCLFLSGQWHYVFKWQGF